MKKLIDFDGLFDEKLAEYIRSNPEKYTEKQWENVIPRLYKQFGDIYVAAAGSTPKEYYASMSDEELCETLERHVAEGVPVSDFLCREIEGRGCTDALVGLLSRREEEILTLAVNLAGSSEKAFPAYFELLTSPVSDDIKEAVCEQLKGGADAAKERALALYEEGKERELMLEILSRCKQRDDRVYEILLNAFRTGDDVPMHASYLAAYGDERALPVLLEYIDRDDINFLEFRELKYAVEALGGEYTRPRDFTSDPYYQEILEQSQLPPEQPSGKSDA
ncbi:MAG TPA: hypothetical protein H9676_06550 [Firmicutes bacterium]|nr:hypothetical protein [Bacillota bacterium]